MRLPPNTRDTLSFAEASHLLGVSAGEMNALREHGLVACLRTGDRQAFPRQTLQLTARLLDIARRQHWSHATLAWFADLAFASEVGRVVLLPLLEGEGASRTALPASWLETSYAHTLVRDLEGRESALVEAMTPLVRSFLAATLGPGLVWEDEAALSRSALLPLLPYLTAHMPGPPLAHLRATSDSGQLFALLVLAFSTLAPPISGELGEIVQSTYEKLRGAASDAAPPEEQERILRERLIAVDKLYASKASEIHAPATQYTLELGILAVQKRTIALQLKLPVETESALDNILDIIRPYLGAYGARVVQALYEVANDPPHWRNPIITVDTNKLLDRLGEKRDRRGIHYSRNRIRLRDTLNAAHNLEIVGEYTTREDGILVRKAVRRPVLSLIGATFDASESASLTTEELFQKGLPKTMQVRLNFYDGVRGTDGNLGEHYVLMPRLAAPQALPPANYAQTHERLRQYLLLRGRQSPGVGAALTLTREEALREAGITNKNVTRATQTLEKALARLAAGGQPTVVHARSAAPAGSVCLRGGREPAADSPAGRMAGRCELPARARCVEMRPVQRFPRSVDDDHLSRWSHKRRTACDQREIFV